VLVHQPLAGLSTSTWVADPAFLSPSICHGEPADTVTKARPEKVESHKNPMSVPQTYSPGEHRQQACPTCPGLLHQPDDIMASGLNHVDLSTLLDDMDQLAPVSMDS